MNLINNYSKLFFTLLLMVNISNTYAQAQEATAAEGAEVSTVCNASVGCDMASAGAECKHVHHVSSQLPYALTVAFVSFLTFVVAGFTHTLGMVTSAIISWIFGVAMLGFALFYLNKRQKGK